MTFRAQRDIRTAPSAEEDHVLTSFLEVKQKRHALEADFSYEVTDL